MALLSVVYTSEAAMTRYLSAAGLEAFTDHEESGSLDSDVLHDCINQATEEIDGYARQRYTQAGLAGSNLIQQWATTLACYFLCLRRGNPPIDSLQIAYDRLLDPDKGLLVRLAQGKYNLPGVALGFDPRPSWSNLRIDRRFPNSQTRVVRANSSDSPSVLGQDHTIETHWDG